MSDLLDKLHHDHVNMAALLDLFAQQVALLQQADADADYHLMLDIVSYFTAYSDVVHHPAEDAVYALLTEREPGVAGDLELLGRQHHELGELGVTLRDLLKGACAGQMVSRERLLELSEDFLERNREHMNREEARVFGAARTALTAAELRHIEATKAATADPVFGRTVDQRFDRLYQAIMAAR